MHLNCCFIIIMIIVMTIYLVQYPISDPLGGPLFIVTHLKVDNHLCTCNFQILLITFALRFIHNKRNNE